MHKIVFSGYRVFMKFGDLSYFKQRAKEAGMKVVGVRSESDDELKEEIRDASAVVVIARTINSGMIEAMQKCKIILALSVGYDCVDVRAATSKGIIVSNTPNYCTDEVANHTVTLLLSVARKLMLIIPRTSDAHWDYNFTRPIFNFKDRKLGIIGLGRIGRCVVLKVRGMGMSVMAYDPYLDDDIFKLLGVERRYELEDLLSEVDYLSIHAPLTPETYHMIDSKALSLLKEHAVIVNTARGGIIDEKALVTALREGRLTGAGLDVLEREPPEAHNPLLTLEQVIITPHIAWYSEESFQREMEDGMDEIVRVLSGHRPRYIVNPEVLWKRNL